MGLHRRPIRLGLAAQRTRQQLLRTRRQRRRIGAWRQWRGIHPLESGGRAESPLAPDGTLRNQHVRRRRPLGHGQRELLLRRACGARPCPRPVRPSLPPGVPRHEATRYPAQQTRAADDDRGRDGGRAHGPPVQGGGRRTRGGTAQCAARRSAAARMVKAVRPGAKPKAAGEAQAYGTAHTA